MRFRFVPVVAVSWWYLTLCSPFPSPAQIRFGPELIRKGNTIEVVRPGPDLQALIDGITDEAPDNRYVIRLGAGDYVLTESLTMARYISLEGSGRESTRLTGAISSATSSLEGVLLVTADSVTVSDLAVVNTGGGAYSYGIVNSFGRSPIIRNVAIDVSGTTTVSVALLTVTSTADLLDVEATATSQGEACGICENSSSSVMSRVSATARGTTLSYAFAFFFNSTSVVDGARSLAESADENYAYWVRGGSAPTLDRIVGTAGGGIRAVGLLAADSNFTLRDGRLTAFNATSANVGIDSTTGTPRIFDTLIFTDGNGEVGINITSDAPVSAAPLLMNVSSTVNAGTGLRFDGLSAGEVRDSRFVSGTGSGIDLGMSSSVISHTTTTSVTNDDGAVVNCREVHDRALVEITC